LICPDVLSGYKCREGVEALMGAQSAAHHDTAGHFGTRDLHHLKLCQAILEKVDQQGCTGWTSAAMI